MIMLEVLSFEFNDQELDWIPNNSFEFHEWVTLLVGENDAGNYYQLQLCASSVISQLESKRYLFVLDEWVTVEHTVSKLNQFINETLTKNMKEDPYYLLGKYWMWEYQGMC